MADAIDAVLNERGQRYGEFNSHAAITQALKDVMRDTAGWKRLSPSQKEALEMNAHKIGRILNGDPNYDDSWRDIAGYARLVEQELVVGSAIKDVAVQKEVTAAPQPTFPVPPKAEAPAAGSVIPPAPPVVPSAPPKIPSRPPV